LKSITCDAKHYACHSPHPSRIARASHRAERRQTARDSPAPFKPRAFEITSATQPPRTARASASRDVPARRHLERFFLRECAPPRRASRTSSRAWRVTTARARDAVTV